MLSCLFVVWDFGFEDDYGFVLVWVVVVCFGVHARGVFGWGFMMSLVGVWVLVAYFEFVYCDYDAVGCVVSGALSFEVCCFIGHASFIFDFGLCGDVGCFGFSLWFRWCLCCFSWGLLFMVCFCCFVGLMLFRCVSA